ncbi:MAG: hypothetical protein ABMA13_13410 [Chthoniobacteraceae bacterium]
MRTIILSLIAFIATVRAQQDAPAIDPAQLLQALQALKDQQTLQAKTSRQAVLKAAQAGAASGPAAASAWIEAVRQTQFEGVEKEGAAFRDWKEKQGALFAEKEVQTAAVLYFRWLTLTTQHALGTPAKDLVPSIIQYTKDVLTDAATMEAMMEHAQKEKDRAGARPGNARNRSANEDDRIKREHDQILSRPLPGSPPVKALRAEELLRIDKWEMRPGDVDGIYSAIILPELRRARDARVLEYWDMKIKQEGEAVKTKSAFDQDKFAKERRTELLWSRAKEYGGLGLRNKAIGELFQILRANPQHPRFNEWVGELETFVAPASPAGSAAGTPGAAR